MKPFLFLTRCPHCGGLHGASAHHDVGYAARLADEALARGDVAEGRRWISVIRRVAKEGRSR